MKHAFGGTGLVLLLFLVTVLVKLTEGRVDLALVILGVRRDPEGAMKNMGARGKAAWRTLLS